MKYKIDFNSLKWETPMQGVRHKYLDQDNLRMRLVEYSYDMPPHWCERGHNGYVLEGEMEIEYDEDKIIYKNGDGIFIPPGKEFRHKARIISDKVLVFFVENVK